MSNHNTTAAAAQIANDASGTTRTIYISVSSYDDAGMPIRIKTEDPALQLLQVVMTNKPESWGTYSSGGGTAVVALTSGKIELLKQHLQQSPSMTISITYDDGIDTKKYTNSTAFIFDGLPTIYLTIYEKE